MQKQPTRPEEFAVDLEEEEARQQSEEVQKRSWTFYFNFKIAFLYFNKGLLLGSQDSSTSQTDDQRQIRGKGRGRGKRGRGDHSDVPSTAAKRKHNDDDSSTLNNDMKKSSSSSAAACQSDDASQTVIMMFLQQLRNLNLNFYLFKQRCNSIVYNIWKMTYLFKAFLNWFVLFIRRCVRCVWIRPFMKSSLIVDICIVSSAPRVLRRVGTRVAPFAGDQSR
jgi:hypothetical protein